MSAALAIVRRDLIRLARSPVRTALLFAVPLLMAVLMASAFGGGDGPDIQLRVLVWDEDETVLSSLLQGAGNADPRLALEWVGDDGLARMDAGEASALLHIPAGFTDDYLAGRPTTLTLIQNPGERFLPRVAEEGAGLGITALDAISRLFRDELATVADLLGSDETPSATTVAKLAGQVTESVNRLDGYLFPPLIELETVTLNESTDDGPSLNILSVIFPGLALIGVLFLAQAATRDVSADRQSGLLRHLLTAPLSPGDYLVGKSLSVVLITFLGFGLLVAIGVAAGVHWGPPLIVATIVAATAIAASGLLMLITSFSRSERAQNMITTIIIMVGSMVGGSFVPLSQLPSFMRPLSRLSLNYWSVDAFDSLIRRGGGWAEVAPNLAVLATLGATFLVIGATMLRKRLITAVA